MFDPFKDHMRNLTSPATSAAAIVPSDSQDLQQLTRAIYVGTGGTAVVDMGSGETVTLEGLVAGVVYPFRVARVRATGTTAAGLVALW